MFALVANVEHGFIAANLYVLHRQLPTLILSAEILQHVPAFLAWSSGRILHFEASRSDRLERGHEVIDPSFAEHVGLGPQKCRHLSCAWYGHCLSPSLIRSAERREGIACDSTCTLRWLPYH